MMAIEVPSWSDHVALIDRVADLERKINELGPSEGGMPLNPPAVYESTNLRVSRLPIKPSPAYEIVCEAIIPEVKVGQTVICYAENHVDPRHTTGKECAIVSGVYCGAYGYVAKAAGQDAYFAQKTQSPRIGAFVSEYHQLNVPVRLYMRALNNHGGGYANIGWAKVGCIVF